MTAPQFLGQYPTKRQAWPSPDFLREFFPIINILLEIKANFCFQIFLLTKE